MNPDPNDYLSSCGAIDFETPAVARLAKSLSEIDHLSTAKKCFEFVRDKIQHSSDFKRNPVTCSASEVFEHKTGFCYAKSHLLCALLRANRIPAGLCYQRLSLDGTEAAYCLHGLTALFLTGPGWYRVDPRGNRGDIDAQFCPPAEKLAFSPDLPGECDLPGIHISPLQEVETVLRQHTTWQDMTRNLPDIEPR